MLKLDFDKLLTGFVLGVVIIWDFIGTTMFSNSLPSIPPILILGVTLLLGFRFIYIRNYSLNFLVTAPILLLSGLLVTNNMSTFSFLTYMLLIVLLYRADIDSALKVYVLISGTMILLTVFLAVIGVIPNLQYLQNRSRGVIIRNSMGFIYPTDFAAHLFYFYAAFTYIWREKYLWFRIALGAVIAFIIFFIADARLNALSTLVVLFLNVYHYYRPKLSIKLAPLVSIASIVCASIMYYLTVHFNWADSRFVMLNNWFSNRLSLGRRAMNTYAVNLFGTPEAKFRGYGGTTETVLNYDYVDSSYIQMLFYLGLVAVVVLVLFYSLQSFRLFNEKQYLLNYLLAIIAANCMIEAFWLRPSYNIFMFLLLGIGSEFVRGYKNEDSKELSI